MNFLKNKMIVVPVDFSDYSAAAVDAAMQMADDSTGIHVIHIVEPTPFVVSFDPAMPIPPQFDHDRHLKAKELLQQTWSTGEFSRLKLHCTIGEPGTEITDFARKQRADMIVMPSHGRTGLSRLLLGSVAERVLRSASCPVLILRGPS
jgi:nucleotide-binding universal stress UspA family protein